jgi:hypothetical protein
VFKIYCDHCGKIIVGKTIHENHIRIADYRRDVDLCLTCSEKLTRIIGDFFDGYDFVRKDDLNESSQD